MSDLNDAILDLYFDESGFTGNNLNDNQQQIFCYSSVNTTEEYAQKIIEQLKIKYRINNNELKGSRLVKRENGKNFLIELLSIFQKDMVVSISNKKFALSAKFFEYIFEPLLSEKNSIFYDINFHLFISNILYAHYLSKDKGANQLLIDFQNLARNNENNYFNESLRLREESAPIIKNLIDFCALNEMKIREKIRDECVDIWTLDLTKSALFSLLSKWGEKRQPLRAFCDESKPLLANQDIFNVMLNRDDIFYQEMGDKTFSLTFNLKKPLILLDSKQSFAIQIADNIASALYYAFDNNADDEDFKNKIKSFIDDQNCYACIQPDFNYLDLNKPEVLRNAIILQGLCERSKENTPLLLNIEQVIYSISLQLGILD